MRMKVYDQLEMDYTVFGTQRYLITNNDDEFSIKRIKNDEALVAYRAPKYMEVDNYV